MLNNIILSVVMSFTPADTPMTNDMFAEFNTTAASEKGKILRDKRRGVRIGDKRREIRITDVLRAPKINAKGRAMKIIDNTWSL